MCYEVMVDSEPTLRFRWNLHTESWEYCPTRFYPYTSMVLDPIEILVRLPIDDALKVSHHPYITNLHDTELAIQIEGSLDKALNMLAKLPPPKCIDNLKKAIEQADLRKNRYSIGNQTV